MATWKKVIRRARNNDGSLFFPEKLTEEFLANARVVMGPYLYSNQYDNEVIPSEFQTFKKKWFRYYEFIPKRTNTFIFIDPALSEADTSDYTGIVVVKVDHQNNWYVPYAKRHRINPTELIKLCFDLYDEWQPNIIGIEEIGFQKALLYFLAEEMRRRDKTIPIQGVKYPSTNSKQTRIISLVPRMEQGHLYLSQGLDDLELELLQFPRGSHDDLLDALNSIEYIAFAPSDKPEEVKKPHSPAHPDYERWRIQEMMKGNNHGDEDRNPDWAD